MAQSTKTEGSEKEQPKPEKQPQEKAVLDVNPDLWKLLSRYRDGTRTSITEAISLGGLPQNGVFVRDIVVINGFVSHSTTFIPNMRLKELFDNSGNVVGYELNGGS